MGTNEYGPWEPLPVDEAIALFMPTSLRWWVSGGHALELHLDRSWRSHDDTDISILRCDAGLLIETLPGWDIHLAAAGDWLYRRDPTIWRSWQDAVLTTTDGVPYLAPELQLLFKSKDVRPKDDVDAQEVIPAPSPRRQSLLRSLLPTAHPWQEIITG